MGKNLLIIQNVGIKVDILRKRKSYNAENFETSLCIQMQFSFSFDVKSILCFNWQLKSFPIPVEKFIK